MWGCGLSLPGGPVFFAMNVRRSREVLAIGWRAWPLSLVRALAECRGKSWRSFSLSYVLFGYRGIKLREVVVL